MTEKRAVLLLICLASGASPCFAADLTGKVTSYVTQKGIAGAKVVVTYGDDEVKEASADAAGVYRVRKLPHGATVEAVYSQVGYRPQEGTTRTPTLSGEETVEDVVLVPGPGQSSEADLIGLADRFVTGIRTQSGQVAEQRDKFAFYANLLPEADRAVVQSRLRKSLGGVSGKLPQAKGAAGAVVELRSATGGELYRTHIDAEGSFDFPVLPSGTYDLFVNREGFQATAANGVRVMPGEQVPLVLDLSADGINVIPLAAMEWNG